MNSFKMILSRESRELSYAVRDLIEDRLRKRFPECARDDPGDWREYVQNFRRVTRRDRDMWLRAIDVMSHGAEMPTITRLDQGGWSTDGPTVSQVCRGCKASFCPVHGAAKRKITLAKVAGRLDAAEDRGVSGYAMVTVTFPEDEKRSFERASAVVTALHPAGQTPTHLRHAGAGALVKRARKATVIRGVETIRHRTEGHSTWTRWGHVHRLVESSGDDHSQIEKDWQVLGGPWAKVHVKEVTETPLRVAGYIAKTERSAAQWRPNFTYMSVGTRALTLHRARAGESIPTEVERARRDLFDWWVTTGGAPNAYTRRTRKGDADAESHTHRAYLDVLYAKREKADDQRDRDQTDTTVSPPTSTDTDTGDDDTPIPANSHRARRPRRSLDDPLPPGYVSRSTLE